MTEPVWLAKEALLLLHANSLARFGGAEGLRDEGLLDSALARPVNIHTYNSENDIPTLAAAYAYGIARDHPFVDGNKRAAFLAAGIFLELNGWSLTASPADAISAVVALASGVITEAQFAEWVRVNSRKLSPVRD